LEPIAVKEIELEPVPVVSAPEPAAPSPTEEIDISNEWEDMIEVEPAEAAQEVEVQSYQEIVPEKVSPAVQPEPVSTKAPEIDLSSQVADKVQEIRFYVTQEMWEPAKAAILDLTELAPDAPEVTELIAAVSAGQAKARAAEAPPIVMEEAPVAFAPIEIEEPAVIEPPPPPPQVEKKALPPEKKVIPVEKKTAPPAEPVAKKQPPVVEPSPEPVLELELEEDVLDIPEPPKAKPSEPVAAQPAAKVPAAKAREKSTEDILSDFVLDLEQ